MKIAYLMNSYPRTSTTFIRREIEALEKAGQQVLRYAGRDWNEDLVDPLDVAEKGRTHYLLSGNLLGLVIAFFQALFLIPLRTARAFSQMVALCINARGGFVRHFAYFLQAIYFKKCAASEGIEHVHVHFSTNATAIAMLSQTLGGPGYSFTVHGPDELVEPALLSLSTKTQKARFVVAITDFCRSQIIWHAGSACADKIQVMRCGLDLSGFEIANAADTENQTLLCIGRLCPQKSQVMLPGVAAKLRAEFPALKIILIGDGESRHEVEAQIKNNNVSDVFELRGWMENVEARKILEASRALLLASAAEGLPIVIMEAMALGKPVISTYIAGIPELLDEACGWIIPAGNEIALEGAMRKALQASQGDLEALGKEGRRRIEAQHNIDDLAGKLLDQFRIQTS